jgi:hypothetical protein
MEYSALKSEYLIKEEGDRKNPKLDWSILKHINRICLQKGLNLKELGLCNVDLDLNVYELDKKNEKGLYLFRCVDVSSYCNKNFNLLGCMSNSMKDFKISIEVPDLYDLKQLNKNSQNSFPQVFSYEPSLIVKKVSEKNNIGIFSYKAVFEIYHLIKFGEKNISEKLNGVITLHKNRSDSYTFYLGRTEDSMKFKIIGNFSEGKQCLFNFCRFNFLKPEKIKFEIFTNNTVNYVPVGFIYKYFRATFDDLESDKTIIYLPEESAPDEKMWFIAVANIINLIIFDKE